MKEIEILYDLLNTIDEAQQLISEFSFENSEKFVFMGKFNTKDTYFHSPFHPDLDPDTEMRLRSALRVRTKEGVSSITYKNDHFDKNDVWLYSDETETSLENGDTMIRILKSLMFEELVCIESIKYIYHSEDYELVIEDVKDLGNFIEVEYRTVDEIAAEEVVDIKKAIRELVQRIGVTVGAEMNAGKPELMLRKIA